MRIRSPARMEDVVVKRHKKSWSDFLLWMGTSNEAYRMVLKFAFITPVFLFGAGIWLCIYYGWVEAAVIDGLFLAISIWNLWARRKLLSQKSGASMYMLSGKGEYGHTYEAVHDDPWGEAFTDGKDKR